VENTVILHSQLGSSCKDLTSTAVEQEEEEEKDEEEEEEAEEVADIKSSNPHLTGGEQ